MEETTKKKRLAKVAEGTILTITEGITGTKMVFDLDNIPEAIKPALLMHGFSQKLGDAAAGKEGQEAVDAINKVYAGLEKGDFTIRVPATEKVSKKSIMDRYNAMAEGEDKEKAAFLLKSLGILA